MTQADTSRRRFKVGACSASVFANQVNNANGPAVIKSVASQPWLGYADRARMGRMETLV